ncbi:MAG: VIT family protein [Microthrixaceae bacterium]
MDAAANSRGRVEGHLHEMHRLHRTGWLRAAVLGANDGIVSTASLMIGVSATGAGSGAVLTAGVAGLAAGAFSMAAGEYVSVSSQRDTEIADTEIERESIRRNPEGELDELTEIYVGRGLSRPLAERVAAELHRHDPLEAHLRDELGLVDSTAARPMQAGLTSAFAFCSGALIPILVGLATTREWILAVVALLALALLGVVGARLGGARPGVAALRVLVGGGLAMAATAGIGTLFGT